MKNEKLKEIIKHQKNIINNLENKLDFQKSENYKLENRIKKAIKEIEYFELQADHLDDNIYLDKTLTNKLSEILKGSESNDNNN